MRDQVEDATFAGLARSATVLLTTFRTSGRAVTTPVSVTVRGNRAYIVTATRLAVATTSSVTGSAAATAWS